MLDRQTSIEPQDTVFWKSTPPGQTQKNRACREVRPQKLVQTTAYWKNPHGKKNQHKPDKHRAFAAQEAFKLLHVNIWHPQSVELPDGEHDSSGVPIELLMKLIPPIPWWLDNPGSKMTGALQQWMFIKGTANTTKRHVFLRTYNELKFSMLPLVLTG